MKKLDPSFSTIAETRDCLGEAYSAVCSISSVDRVIQRLENPTKGGSFEITIRVRNSENEHWNDYAGFELLQENKSIAFFLEAMYSYREWLAQFARNISSTFLDNPKG